MGKPGRSGRRVARSRVEQGADADLGAALRPCLGDARPLDVELVEERVAGLRHDACRTDGSSRWMRRAEQDDASETVHLSACGRRPTTLDAPVRIGLRRDYAE
jgi:hypothetical protein